MFIEKILTIIRTIIDLNEITNNIISFPVRWVASGPDHMICVSELTNIPKAAFDSPVPKFESVVPQTAFDSPVPKNKPVVPIAAGGSQVASSVPRPYLSMSSCPEYGSRRYLLYHSNQISSSDDYLKYKYSQMVPHECSKCKDGCQSFYAYYAHITSLDPSDLDQGHKVSRVQELDTPNKPRLLITLAQQEKMNDRILAARLHSSKNTTFVNPDPDHIRAVLGKPYRPSMHWPKEYAEVTRASLKALRIFYGMFRC